MLCENCKNKTQVCTPTLWKGEYSCVRFEEEEEKCCETCWKQCDQMPSDACCPRWEKLNESQ